MCTSDAWLDTDTVNADINMMMIIIYGRVKRIFGVRKNLSSVLSETEKRCHPATIVNLEELHRNFEVLVATRRPLDKGRDLVKWNIFCILQRSVRWSSFFLKEDQMNPHCRCNSCKLNGEFVHWEEVNYGCCCTRPRRAVSVFHDSSVSLWDVVCLGASALILLKDSGLRMTTRFKRGPSGNHWRRLQPRSNKSFCFFYSHKTHFSLRRHVGLRSPKRGRSCSTCSNSSLTSPILTASLPLWPQREVLDQAADPYHCRPRDTELIVPLWVCACVRACADGEQERWTQRNPEATGNPQRQWDWESEVWLIEQKTASRGGKRKQEKFCCLFSPSDKPAAL